ncbi:MAG: hypothetical protein ACR2MB_04000 [Acidimicrobiales bacterium]
MARTGGRVLAGSNGRTAVLVGATASLLVSASRWWVRNGADPLVWNDTADYLASAGTGWLAPERWYGLRPVLMPALLSAVGSDLESFVTVQTVAAAASWGLLAAAVASSLPRGWRPWVGGATVVAVGVTWPVAMWDQQVLTESLALSTLALVAAAAVWAAQGLDRRRAVALVVSVALWLAVRDSHVVPVAVAAVGLGAWALVRRPRRRRLTVLVAAYLGALAFLVAGAAQAGHRDRMPLEHVYAARVLPYAERVAWFHSHGMPEVPLLLAVPKATTPQGAVFTPLAPAPAYASWRSWLARSGRSTLARYALVHPGYLVGETQHSPERVFNNGEGLATYRPLQMRRVPAVGQVGYLPILAAVAGAAVTVSVADWRRTLTSAPFVAGAVLVTTALPHALVVWHSDAMESARHLLIPSIQARLGALLMVVGAVLAGPSPQTTSRRTTLGNEGAQRPSESESTNTVR